MNPADTPRVAHVTKRFICALLAFCFVATVFGAIFNCLRIGQVPPVGDLLAIAAGLPGAYLFGLYAFEGGRSVEYGVLAEPSEKVRNLAIRPGSKVEAIKAYRQQTGVDVRRARAVVERLAAPGRSAA